MVQMVREGSGEGRPPNCTDFTAEFGVSRRTVARDLDFLRDEERAPLAYDDARHGFRLIRVSISTTWAPRRNETRLLTVSGTCSTEGRSPALS